MISSDNIPLLLRERPQWVLWRTIMRDKPTKVPFSIDGSPAKANDSATWHSFDEVMTAYGKGGYDGIGYEFSEKDPFCGIDLDGCRNPETGEAAEWAKKIVASLATYAEVSPSGTGVKLFAKGKLPFDTGRKIELPNEPTMCADKVPAIEAYDHLRYFAVTGLRVAGMEKIADIASKLPALCERYFPKAKTRESNSYYMPPAVMDRARKYLARCEPAVSGQGGHNVTFRVACILALGFMLEREQSLILLREWNQLCNPPWSEKELEHKVDSAIKQPGDRGYLRNTRQEDWGSVVVPKYEPPQIKKRRLTSLSDASQQYIDRVRAGKVNLIPMRLPELDFAIGGGVELGEMVIVAARPSHGKSAVALQCAHNWTADGIPVLFVTEEMSAMALGKRTLQFASQLPQEDWRASIADLEIDFHQFASERADCYIAESCGTTAAVVAEIERAVEEHQIRAAIVDYAQLLSSPGATRYEQITNTSIALRKVASDQKIVLLVLCQLNREIEARPSFQPKTSDLRDTGQLEQDADVIIFLVWPHRIDPKQPPHNFKFYIAKNRNREICKPVVECRFEPSRQMLTGLRARDMPNYEPAFKDYDRSDKWD